MSDWISVEDKLPENFGTWKEYLITMLYPRSEYEYRVVATALYDSRQKIWHLNPFSEEGEEKTVNALILPCTAENGEIKTTHWMPLPKSPYEF